MEGTLIPTYLMSLINKAWNSFFARIDKNKKAIAERGWNPLNFNLLLNEEIRATMTKEEKDNEETSDDVILPSITSNSPSESENISTDRDNSNNSATDTENTSLITAVSAHQVSLNFEAGTSAFCLDAIVKQE